MRILQSPHWPKLRRSLAEAWPKLSRSFTPCVHLVSRGFRKASYVFALEVLTTSFPCPLHDKIPWPSKRLCICTVGRTLLSNSLGLLQATFFSICRLLVRQLRICSQSVNLYTLELHIVHFFWLGGHQTRTATCW